MSVDEARRRMDARHEKAIADLALHLVLKTLDAAEAFRIAEEFCKLTERRAMAGDCRGDSIETLNLSPKTAASLRRYGIETIGTLIAKANADMRWLVNMGDERLNEIQDALQGKGLRLK